MNNYVIFDTLCPFLDPAPYKSGVRLLEDLCIAKDTTKTTKADPGYDLHSLNPELFVQVFVKDLYEIGSASKAIIALEDSSYLTLNFVKSFLEKNVTLRDELEQILSNKGHANKDIASIRHINTIILEQIDEISKGVKFSYKGLKASFYLGNSIEFSIYKNSDIDRLFKVLELERVHFSNELYPNGYEIFSYSPDIAQKIAGKVMLDAKRGGADFLIVNDIRAYTFFTTLYKKIEKSIGEKLDLEVFSLSQIVLMGLDVTDKKILGLDKQKLRPAPILH